MSDDLKEVWDVVVRLNKEPLPRHGQTTLPNEELRVLLAAAETLIGLPDTIELEPVQVLRATSLWREAHGYPEDRRPDLGQPVAWLMGRLRLADQVIRFAKDTIDAWVNGEAYARVFMLGRVFSQMYQIYEVPSNIEPETPSEKP